MEWITNNWFLLFFLALCLGMHFLGGHGRHGKHADEEIEEHKGHAHAGSQDGSPAKKGHGGCH